MYHFGQTFKGTFCKRIERERAREEERKVECLKFFMERQKRESPAMVLPARLCVLRGSVLACFSWMKSSFMI